MKRFNRYKEFRQKVKWATKKLADMKTCPLGESAIIGHHKANSIFNSLNDKWQSLVMAKVEEKIAPYYQEDENGYSAYTMDMAMMGY